MVTAFGPGRVNLVGEHTDYNEGLALAFAIDAGVTVRAEPGPPGRVEAHAVDVGEADVFDSDQPAPAHGWRAYVRGVVTELRTAGFAVPGASLSISGTVPIGAGLSSSAALETALCLALLALEGAAPPDPLTLARLCARVENEHAGVRTGLLDQLTALRSRPDSALRIDFRSLRVEVVPRDLQGWTLATMDSGDRRELSASGYNARRGECRRACHALGVASLREARAEDAARLPRPLGDRVAHVLGENARVDAAVAALRVGDVAALGPILTESHRSLAELYDCSTPGVDATVARLVGSGAAGARMIGGGFGGHVLALFPPGVEPPADARPVTPGAGARVLAR